MIKDTTILEALLQEHVLVGERSKETHYYIVRSELATHSSKGVLKSTDVYREVLKLNRGTDLLEKLIDLHAKGSQSKEEIIQK
jgi:hypothetical protein